MKKRHIIFLLFGAAVSAAAWIAIFTVAHSFAATSSVKLPYAKGQRFIVTQGYDTPPTHIKKDSYALDLTQNGCDAYGKQVVAAASGKAMFLSQEGYNGGYGTELIIDHGNDVVSRYAHMIPDSISVPATGTVIRQGQAIGLLGDTGLVAGAACADHPGTHLHFAMDTVGDDGTFSALDPEPISGYTAMTAGNWYLSDNGEDDGDAAVTTDATDSVASVVTATTTFIASPAVIASSSSFSSIGAAVFSGGVSVTTGSEDFSPPATISTSTATATATATSTDDAGAANASSTTSDATSTSNNATDTTETFSSSTALSPSPSSTSTSTASSSDILFSQLDDGVHSPQSFYDDNWFDLGNGFGGTLNALTLEGAVSDVRYSTSHVALQEFKDKDYTVLVQQIPISDDAPFTPVMATATFSGLSIRLKPYFYYRLFTVEDLQNRSVILAGTATTTTGTVMWNYFVYGAGRVEYTKPFFPFIVMEGVAATSTLTPPPLTAPTNLAEDFNQLTSQLTVSWSTSTDPDWPANPLHYEMNYSTSTSLSESGWTDPGPIPVVVGNTYLIGIRAADNYGDLSAVATTTWNFPAGFVPYLLSPELSYAYQYFTAPFTSTLQSIRLFTTDLQSGARYPEYTWCTLSLYDSYALSSVGMTPADNTVSGYGCAGTPTFSFASSSLMLHPDHQYQWIFNGQTGNPSTGMSVRFYGTAASTAGGVFSDPSLVNAKFTVNGDAGVLFSN